MGTDDLGARARDSAELLRGAETEIEHFDQAHDRLVLDGLRESQLKEFDSVVALALSKVSEKQREVEKHNRYESEMAARYPNSSTPPDLREVQLMSLVVKERDYHVFIFVLSSRTLCSRRYENARDEKVLLLPPDAFALLMTEGRHAIEKSTERAELCRPADEVIHQWIDEVRRVWLARVEDEEEALDFLSQENITDFVKVCLRAATKKLKPGDLAGMISKDANLWDSLPQEFMKCLKAWAKNPNAREIFQEHPFEVDAEVLVDWLRKNRSDLASVVIKWPDQTAMDWLLRQCDWLKGQFLWPTGRRLEPVNQTGWGLTPVSEPDSHPTLKEVGQKPGFHLTPLKDDQNEQN